MLAPLLHGPQRGCWGGCRRYKQRQAIYEADDGEAPPLYNKVTPALLWGSMYGTEHLDPSCLRRWKATAVRLSCASLHAPWGAGGGGNAMAGEG